MNSPFDRSQPQRVTPAKGHLLPRHLESDSVLLFVLTNHNEISFARDLAEVARLQLQTGGFLPVVATDFPGIQEVYAYGFTVEYIPATDTSPWSTAAEDKLTAIMATYAPQQFVIYDGGQQQDSSAARAFATSLVGKMLASGRRAGAQRPDASLAPPTTWLSLYFVRYIRMRIGLVGWRETLRRPLAKIGYRLRSLLFGI